MQKSKIKMQNDNVKLQNNKVAKIKIGWFSFSCCEDNLIVFTELLNDHWREWKKIFDFRHVNALKSKNIFDELDIAFIEGAVASEKHKKKMEEIRKIAKKVVAVGSCAITGMPSGQRNFFTEEQNKNIEPLIEHFASFPKALKISEVIKIDAEAPGCPMNQEDFLKIVDGLARELNRNIMGY